MKAQVYFYKHICNECEPLDSQVQSQPLICDSNCTIEFEEMIILQLIMSITHTHYSLHAPITHAPNRRMH